MKSALANEILVNSRPIAVGLLVRELVARIAHRGTDAQGGEDQHEPVAKGETGHSALPNAEVVHQRIGLLVSTLADANGADHEGEQQEEGDRSANDVGDHSSLHGMGAPRRALAAPGTARWPALARGLGGIAEAGGRGPVVAERLVVAVEDQSTAPDRLLANAGHSVLNQHILGPDEALLLHGADLQAADKATHGSANSSLREAARRAVSNRLGGGRHTRTRRGISVSGGWDRDVAGAERLPVALAVEREPGERGHAAARADASLAAVAIKSSPPALRAASASSDSAYRMSGRSAVSFLEMVP